MKILLTGGAGYVGSACLRWLLHHGHDPIAYDSLVEGNVAAVPDASNRLVWVTSPRAIALPRCCGGTDRNAGKDRPGAGMVAPLQ